MREKLSALLDGELQADERDELIRHISRDEELGELWSRYHLYRAVFRDESFSYDPGLSGKIVSSLDNSHDFIDDKDNLGDLAARGVKPVQSTQRPLLAIAASLVLATAVAVYSLSLSPPAATVDSIASLEQRTKWEMDQEHEDALNGFLVEHGEFVNAPGMNGLMAYAKFVSYDSVPE